MNICFITSDFPDALKGGVERVVYNLTKIFTANGHNVITLSKDSSCQNKYVKDINFHLKDNLNILCPSNINFTIQLVKQHKINIVIYASHHRDMFKLALEIKKQTNCKLITTYYNCPNAILKGVMDESAKIRFSNKSIIRKFLLYLFLKIGYKIKLKKRRKYLEYFFSYQYKNSDAFVVESQYYIEILRKFIKEENTPKIFSISNPISKFENKLETKREKIVLYIARMNLEQKRPDRMLRIWKKVQKKCPDWNLIMIGDGPNKKDMIRYSEKLSLKNIRFIGNSELLPYYKNSEILCMTSTYEGFGLVLTEALQNKVIPIAFNSYEAIQDIIHDNITGALIKPFNENLYAQKLCTIMNNSNLRKEYRENIEKVNIEDKFGAYTIYNKWLNIFNSL